MAAAPANSERGTEVREDWVTVLTTLPMLPLPANTARAVLTTERLVVRPLAADDLDALHVLRTLPEVMANTKRGTVDADKAETLTRLTPFLAPNDATTFNCAICLREPGDNRLIGIGGVHLFKGPFGWPELGYMFHSAHWGKGYATEFVRGFLTLYAALPRPPAPVALEVTRETLPSGWEEGPKGAGGIPIVEEKLTGIVPYWNTSSQGVMKKAGFEHFLTIDEDDSTKPGEQKKVALFIFQHFPGRLLKAVS